MGEISIATSDTNSRAVGERREFIVIRTDDPEIVQLVCDRHRNVDVDLTLFALKAVQSLGLAAATVRVYLYHLIDFCSWVASDPIVNRESWERHGPPETVRQLVDRYLRHVALCDLTYKRDRYGLDVCFVKISSRTRRQLVPVLAALRAYYELLRHKRRYPYSNPLESIAGRQLRERLLHDDADAFQLRNGRPRMSARSGVDEPYSVDLPSTAYFRPVNCAWRPIVKADPVLSAKVLRAGEAHGWRLQQLTIGRLLFRTGARIAEICGMTLLGWWQASQFGRTAMITNKGSRQMPTKEVVLDKTSQKFLRDYINAERANYDRLGRTLTTFERLALRGDLDPNEPVFLNSRGTQLSAQHFRDYYWRPAMQGELSGLTPHAARHNMVTLHLAEIDRIAKTSKERELLRLEFVAQMSWASGESMLKVYDSRSPGRRILDVMERVHKDMSRRERSYDSDGGGDAERPIEVGGEGADLVALLVGAADA